MLKQRKNKPTEHFKGGFNYPFLFCVLGVSFRGGDRVGGLNAVTRPVFHSRKTTENGQNQTQHF